MSYEGTESSATGGGAHEASRAASPPAGTGQAPPAGPAESATVANSEPDASAEQQPQPQQHKTARQKMRAFYDRNFGLFLIFLAEIFASLMVMTTRLLETAFETKFHALEIIFVRMLCTAVLGSLYMGLKRVPHFPLGIPSVRGLLVLRGAAGFLGLACNYYSLAYLNVSDATVITFLVPTLTAFICFVVLKEPFTLNEALAGIVAFVGVLFIARPTVLFPRPETPEEGLGILSSSTGLVPTVPATPAERSLAVLLAVIGSFAAATAYSTIRIIGTRVHSLVSVNYFAAVATVGSFFCILVHPDLHFQLPQNAAQWGLLATIGIAGFLLQFLITEGLQREKGGRATNMIYTQLVSALVIDRVVWGTTPAGWSLVGSALIIAAAVWVTLQKSKAPTVPPKTAPVDEESSLLGNSGDAESRRA